MRTRIPDGTLRMLQQFDRIGGSIPTLSLHRRRAQSLARAQPLARCFIMQGNLTRHICLASAKHVLKPLGNAYVPFTAARRGLTMIEHLAIQPMREHKKG